MQRLRPPSLLAALAVATLLSSGTGAFGQVCGDVNDSGSVTAGDALSVLKAAVGQDVELVCTTGDCIALDERVTTLEGALDSALDSVAELQGMVAELSERLAGVSRAGSTLVFSGMNLQVVDGSGTTAGPVNGLGNLIVGYNERGDEQLRTGSHNVVVGEEHAYSSFGGIVAGEGNSIAARGASVLGGTSNVASGLYATVSGGFDNTASGSNASISGGCENVANNNFSAVSGGQKGLASGAFSSVSGGYTNQSTASHASVSGGSTRSAAGQYDWRAGTLFETE